MLHYFSFKSKCHVKFILTYFHLPLVFLILVFASVSNYRFASTELKFILYNLFKFLNLGEEEACPPQQHGPVAGPAPLLPHEGCRPRHPGALHGQQDGVRGRPRVLR